MWGQSHRAVGASFTVQTTVPGIHNPGSMHAMAQFLIL